MICDTLSGCNIVLFYVSCIGNDTTGVYIKDKYDDMDGYVSLALINESG